MMLRLLELLGVRVGRLADFARVGIVTPRLRLRALRPFDDWPRFREYHRDPEVVRHLSPRADTDAKLRATLKAYAALDAVSPGYLHLGIQLAGESRLLGDICLLTDRVHHHRGILGFVLHRDAWGRGIATEAARAVVDHAFRVTRYREVWAGCTRQNDRSRRVLEKVGLAHTVEKMVFPGEPEGAETLAFRVDGATWMRQAGPANTGVGPAR